MASPAERKGRNEAIFRAANENREQRALGIVGQAPDEPIPFLCECADVECNDVALVTLREYEEVRSHPARGLAIPGHEDLDVERVVARDGRFVTVEKFGEAGETYADADPRRPAG